MNKGIPNWKGFHCNNWNKGRELNLFFFRLCFIPLKWKVLINFCLKNINKCLKRHLQTSFKGTKICTRKSSDFHLQTILLTLQVFMTLEYFPYSSNSSKNLILNSFVPVNFLLLSFVFGSVSFSLFFFYERVTGENLSLLLQNSKIFTSEKSWVRFDGSLKSANCGKKIPGIMNSPFLGFWKDLLPSNFKKGKQFILRLFC